MRPPMVWSIDGARGCIEQGWWNFSKNSRFISLLIIRNTRTRREKETVFSRPAEAGENSSLTISEGEGVGRGVEKRWYRNHGTAVLSRLHRLVTRLTRIYGSFYARPNDPSRLLVNMNGKSGRETLQRVAFRACLGKQQSGLLCGYLPLSSVRATSLERINFRLTKIDEGHALSLSPRRYLPRLFVRLVVIRSSSS